jgi:hypothetical protein
MRPQRVALSTEEHVAEMLSAAEVGAQDFATLSSLPLEELMPYASWENTKLATNTPTLDVSGHAAAHSAMAKSMLKRMKTMSSSTSRMNCRPPSCNACRLKCCSECFLSQMIPMRAAG